MIMEDEEISDETPFDGEDTSEATDEEIQKRKDARAAILGFHPQKEIIYNTILLPYSESLDKESIDMWNDIKVNLGKSVALREMRPGYVMWTGRLSKYVIEYPIFITSHFIFITTNFYIIREKFRKLARFSELKSPDLASFFQFRKFHTKYPDFTVIFENPEMDEIFQVFKIPPKHSLSGFCLDSGNFVVVRILNVLGFFQIHEVVRSEIQQRRPH